MIEYSRRGGFIRVEPNYRFTVRLSNLTFSCSDSSPLGWFFVFDVILLFQRLLATFYAYLHGTFEYGTSTGL